MRVQIVEGNFSGERGNAEMTKSLEPIVWLDILPDYPMKFYERELLRLTASDCAEHESDSSKRDLP